MITVNASIQIIGVNPYVLVTREQAHRLKPGWKKPLPVLLKVNDKPAGWWRINMMPVGNGDFYLYLHGEVRKASQTKVGDIVEVKLKFDHQYRSGPMHPMPEWFEVALRGNPIAQSNWDALSPSRQKEVLRYFDRLKSEEAKQRNLARILEALSGQSAQFMGRPWRNGA